MAPRTTGQGRETAIRLMAAGTPLGTGLAAQLLGVSRQTVARWCRSGRIGAFRNGGGQWRVPASEVAARLLSREDVL